MNGSLGCDRISMNMMYLAIQTLILVVSKASYALIQCLTLVCPVESVTSLKVSLGVFKMFIKYSFKMCTSCQILGGIYTRYKIFYWPVHCVIFAIRLLELSFLMLLFAAQANVPRPAGSGGLSLQTERKRILWSMLSGWIVSIYMSQVLSVKSLKDQLFMKDTRKFTKRLVPFVI